MKNFPYQSASELLQALSQKNITSLELVNLAIQRIEALDPKINAVIIKDFDRARQAAKAADEVRSKGQSTPLLGLPMTVKESFNVAGLETTWGNPEYKNWVPLEDSVAVARLKEAGAIILGKTNVAWMLQDWQSYNDVYGVTNNPWDCALTAGGSSGGSAAALAAGFVSLELGSDLAGSLRIPAHFCGIFSHKPSQDLIPLRGASPPQTPALPNRIDLAVAGPMARTAHDLELSLSVLAGPDPMTEGKGYSLALPKARHRALKDFTVLVIDTHPLCPTETCITQALNNLAEHLRRCGATVSQDKKYFPDLAKTTEIYSSLLTAFGAADTPQDLYHSYEKIAKKLSPDDQSIDAAFLRGCVFSHRDWLQAMRVRERLRNEWRQVFKRFDVILCPVTSVCAFPHDHTHPDKRHINIDHQIVPYAHLVAWPSFASLLGLPATALPIAFSDTGLPIGMQIIGDYLEDYTTIECAKLIAQEFGGFTPPLLD